MQTQPLAKVFRARALSSSSSRLSGSHSRHLHRRNARHSFRFQRGKRCDSNLNCAFDTTLNSLSPDDLPLPLPASPLQTRVFGRVHNVILQDPPYV